MSHCTAITLEDDKLDIVSEEILIGADKIEEFGA